MIDINYKIDKEIVRDLLTAAFEGGSNYWYQNLDWKGGGPYYEADFMAPEDDPQLRFEDCDGGRHNLTEKEIKRGLAVMSEKYPLHFADAITDRSDAITGDVFLQCCAFGCIIYG